MNKLFMRGGIVLAAAVLMMLLAVPAVQAKSLPDRPDRRSYAAMTAEEAAWLFFNACDRRDWGEVGNFWPMPLNDQFKKYVGGLEVLGVGQSFKSTTGPSLFVPYKIRLSNGEVKKYRLSMRNDNADRRWIVDGGL